jgi:hypothetical protein
MGVSPATAPRHLRKAVTLPDGRQIAGQAPAVSGGKLPEHELRDKLASQLDGITEAVLPYGRADVLTRLACDLVQERVPEHAGLASGAHWLTVL